jgi:hypothetical protein
MPGIHASSSLSVAEEVGKLRQQATTSVAGISGGGLAKGTPWDSHSYSVGLRLGVPPLLAVRILFPRGQALITCISRARGFLQIVRRVRIFKPCFLKHLSRRDIQN